MDEILTEEKGEKNLREDIGPPGPSAEDRQLSRAERLCQAKLLLKPVQLPIGVV